MTRNDLPSRAAALAFMASQAMLYLAMLMGVVVLLVALAPVAMHYLTQGGQRAAATVHRACHPVLVTFVRDVSLGTLNQVLAAQGSRIAAGPNVQGAFELNVGGQDPDAVVDALNRLDAIVVIASLQEQCIPVHPSVGSK